MKKIVFYLCQLCVDTRLVKIIIYYARALTGCQKKKFEIVWGQIVQKKTSIICAGVCNIATNKLLKVFIEPGE